MLCRLARRSISDEILGKTAAVLLFEILCVSFKYTQCVYGITVNTDSISYKKKENG